MTGKKSITDRISETGDQCFFNALFSIRRDAEAGKAEETKTEKVFSRQPFLLRAKRMSGSAIQGKQLQRLPHAYSVHVV